MTTHLSRLALNVDLLLSELIPTVEAFVARQKQAIDGWPIRGERVGGRGNAELTGPEAAAHQRRQLELDLADIRAGKHLLEVTVKDMLKSCDDMLRRRRDIEPEATKPKQCDASGRDGSLEWGDPTCREVSEAASGGPCDKHARAERRWRNLNGKPDRRVKAEAA